MMNWGVGMTEEQARAHQQSVLKARTILREANETELKATKRQRTPQEIAREAHARSERRRNRNPRVARLRESDVLIACCDVLERHPRIAFWWARGASLMAVSTVGTFVMCVWVPVDAECFRTAIHAAIEKES
jgi:hypothetical protein